MSDMTLGRRLDLVVIGEINPDIVVTGADLEPSFGQVEKLVDGIRLTIGSSSAIFACGAARLGLRTAFVGAVGDDALGRYMLASMSERGLDVSACRILPEVATGATLVFARDKDHGMLTALGAIGALRVEHVPPELLSQTRHVHVGSYFLQRSAQEGLPGLLAEAKATGATTSFDCNWDPSGSWDQGIDRMLQVADVFLPNADEAKRLTGQDDAEGAARALVARSGSGRLTVAVKMGARGALGLRDAELERVKAFTMEPVDTIGAGDSFDAGFVYGWLKGWPMHKCLELGIACGSLSTRRLGGTEAQPTLEEAMTAVYREHNA